MVIIGLMKFPILINKPMHYLLLPFGVTQEQAYVEITETQLVVSFGRLFHEVFPLSLVAGVEYASHPWWGGLGIRYVGGKNKVVTVAGAYKNLVAIHFTEWVPMHVLIVLRSRELRLSLQDPEGFIQALRSKTVQKE